MTIGEGLGFLKNVDKDSPFHLGEQDDKKLGEEMKFEDEMNNILGKYETEKNLTTEFK